ncbi:high affinity choline transporter 1-like isoform X5 [Anarhichas minor]|uniref:high affinity choline transporter 1-like isoform X5 n=1 Tax=Anarhichas minor TaxID=65739 RepID=UPI003F7371ED
MQICRLHYQRRANHIHTEPHALLQKTDGLGDSEPQAVTRRMAVNWPGLVSIGVFYMMILGTGIWASMKSKREEKKCTGNRSEVTMVGGRNLNIWVSICTLTGGTIGVVMDISSSLAVGISAAVAVLYTLMGGLYSVAYTDVVQLGLMLVGLWLCVPFILANPSSANITLAAVTKLHQEPWIGRLKPEEAGRWVDNLLLMAIGGICYQAFYQRVLSTATDAQAKITCYAAAVLCPILAIPSLVIGAAAASTNWNETSYGSPSPYEQGKAGMILPIALQHLCPFYISLIGMGALASSVMSSVDSALLSSASQLGRNIFKNIFYKGASEKLIIIVVKGSILLCGIMGAGLAMTTKSVHLFWIISADVFYSMMAPQVICIFYLSRRVNHYGACAGFVLALLLRALVGEPGIGLPDILPLPWDKMVDGHRYRLLPFRTAIMLATMATILVVSCFASWLSEKGLLRRISDAETDTHMTYMAPVQMDVEEKKTERTASLIRST